MNWIGFTEKKPKDFLQTEEFTIPTWNPTKNNVSFYLQSNILVETSDIPKIATFVFAFIVWFFKKILNNCEIQSRNFSCNEWSTSFDLSAFLQQLQTSSQKVIWISGNMQKDLKKSVHYFKCFCTLKKYHQCLHFSCLHLFHFILGPFFFFFLHFQTKKDE